MGSLRYAVLPKKMAVFGVWPYPKPMDRAFTQSAKRPPIRADANRIQTFISLDGLEAKARQRRAFFPEKKILSCLSLNARRQLFQQTPEALGGCRFHRPPGNSSGNVSPASISWSASATSSSRRDCAFGALRRREASPLISSMIAAAMRFC